MMDRVDREIHKIFAEDGIEKNPTEVRRIHRLVFDLCRAVSARRYERYKFMTLPDMPREARRMGVSLDEFLEIHDLVLHIGRKKYETNLTEEA